MKDREETQVNRSESNKSLSSHCWHWSMNMGYPYPLHGVESCSDIIKLPRISKSVQWVEYID